MAEEACTITADWNNDKSDEIFFSLLGELLQNNTRATELYTLLSSQANNKTQFQNDNEYRCKEDAIDEEHEESDLNKLVDILKTRLQNGKSVPAGLTQEKLTRLKDDFLKQKEENKRTEQNHDIPLKKTKNAAPVSVAKPKPKNKKQLQAEQRRRELEMANIAKELEEKKKKKEEKELSRKNQEKERKRLIEEDLKKQEEDRKRIMNENKKRKEKEEKEKEYQNQKEKERQEKLRKSQEEEARKKEEEKRRKAEEKTAKQKALKEGKEREEREKLEKQQSQKSQGKVRSQQYQQYQQQQQKYPREVPPRFLRAQQAKQQVLQKDQDHSSNEQYRENSNWTEIVPDPQYEPNNVEDWEVDVSNEKSSTNTNDQGRTFSSWGGIPASEDWDLDANKQTSNVNHISESRTLENCVPSSDSIGSKLLQTSFVSPHSTNAAPPNDKQVTGNNDSCWGASLTGSTWDTGAHNANQWDVDSGKSKNSQEEHVSPSVVSKNPQASINSTTWSKYASKPTDSNKSDSPGITPWAGLDSFEAVPNVIQEDVHHIQTPISSDNIAYPGGAKPKTSNVGVGTFNNSYHNETTDKVKSLHTCLKEQDSNNEQTESNGVSSIDNKIESKIDTNLKVTGWLESSTLSDDWDDDDNENSEDFGWTTVSLKTKKTASGSSNPVISAPGTPSKSENGNAWTNRALKQLLDMGFKRELAEKALRDNNGIIESAVSDLLMKGDMAESSSQQGTSKADNPMSSNNTSVSLASTPQKLNRKQRRKLQQMQNADQSKDNQDSTEEKSNLLTTSSDSTHNLSTNLTVKQKGDGLLPTPPPSLRLVPNEEPTPLDKTITRPQPAKHHPGEIGTNLLKTSSVLPQPIDPQSSKMNTEQSTSAAHAPIGSSRPLMQAPIQPPNSQPKPQPSSKDTMEQQMNGIPLQPPVNPVLLAQMHLQKLGLENPPTVSSSFSQSVVPTPVSTQTVTNSMIQQYLKQIAQTSEADNPAAASSSPISTPMHNASPLHLSGLLQQAPVPASSLSEGPQKSKLLQWTQPSSASNSEPTTPPTTVDFYEEPIKERPSPISNVDPVSAKWGVVAMPLLLPTPAEFTPGVQWKPRGESNDDKDNEDEESSSDNSDSESDTSEDERRPTKTEPVQPVPIPEPIPVKAVEKKNPTPPPPQPEPRRQSPIIVAPLKVPEEPEQPPMVRPPPGLGSINSFGSSSNSFNGSVRNNSFSNGPMNSFNGMKNNVDEMNWLTIRGLSSTIDPSSIRSLCQRFGTLLDFRLLGNTTYVRYETHAHAHSAYISLNGKLFYNSQILAEVLTEHECMKAIEISSSMMNPTPPIATVPLTNHISQPLGFPNMSSFGGLSMSPWATPAPAPPPPSVPQPFPQQSFTAPSYNVPSSINMNGGFAHWGMPTPATSVMPDSNQLWRAAAPQPPPPTNVFQTYSGWLPAKPGNISVQAPASIFSPGMDRCLPSEFFNAKEHGS